MIDREKTEPLRGELSDKTAGTIFENTSDGFTRYYGRDRVYASIEARYAAHIVSGIAAAVTVRQALVDDASEALPSPKKIASFACDIAQQLMYQCCDRQWMLFIADPHPTVPPKTEEPL